MQVKVVDLTHPPIEWVESTVSRSKPSHIGHVLETIVWNLGIESESQSTFPGLSPRESEDRLARQILLDSPNFMCGNNPLNRYTHGVWAMLVANQLGEAEQLAKTALSAAKSVKLPLPFFLCTCMVALRMGDIITAKETIIHAWNQHHPRENLHFRLLLELVSRSH